MTDSRLYFDKRLSDTDYAVVNLSDLSSPVRRLMVDNVTAFYSEEKKNRLCKIAYDFSVSHDKLDWLLDGLERPTAIAVDESGVIYLANGDRYKSIMLLNQQGDVSDTHP